MYIINLAIVNKIKFYLKLKVINNSGLIVYMNFKKDKSAIIISLKYS